MGFSDCRLSVYWPGQDEPLLLKPHPSTGLLSNFQYCPHCEKNGRPPIIQRLNEGGPVVSRSDGESFHLILNDRPMPYPAEKSSGKTEMMSAGFWYIAEGEDTNIALTKTAVVILQKVPKDSLAVLRQLEAIADRLADNIVKWGHLEALYEFEGTYLRELY